MLTTCHIGSDLLGKTMFLDCWLTLIRSVSKTWTIRSTPHSKPASVFASGLMCSYSAVNGVRACADADLLTTLARNIWGFDGYIVSDCDAVHNLYANHFYRNADRAVAVTLKAAGKAGN